MRKPMYIFMIFFITLSCNNSPSSPESTETASETAPQQNNDAQPNSSAMRDTSTVGAGITAAEVILEVVDSKTGNTVTNANVTLTHERGTITFSPTDMDGKYFTMDDLNGLTGLHLHVSKAGYTDYAKSMASAGEMPTQVKISAR